MHDKETNDFGAGLKLEIETTTEKFLIQIGEFPEGTAQGLGTETQGLRFVYTCRYYYNYKGLQLDQNGNITTLDFDCTWRQNASKL